MTTFEETQDRTWHATIALDSLPTDGTGRVVELEIEGASFRLALFVCEDGEVRCLDDACPHQGASLGDGVLAGGDVTCPWHAWHFDPKTGENTDGLDACVAVHPVRVNAAGVVEVALAAGDAAGICDEAGEGL